MAKKTILCPACQGKGEDNNFFPCVCKVCNKKGTIEVDK